MLFRRRQRKRSKAELAEYTVTLLPSARELRVREDQSVLEAALAAGLPFPHQCKAALCRSCRCRLQKGEVHLRKPVCPPLTPDEVEAGLILACQAEPRADLCIHVEARGNRPIPPAGSD